MIRQKKTLTAIRLAIIFFLLTANSSPNLAAAKINPLFQPLTALSAQQLAIIVNDNDPLSVRIAQYYQQQRHIPKANIIHVHFHFFGNALSASSFLEIKQEVDKQTPKAVQAFVLTWIRPFKVDCMSITTAFAAGFDQSFCAQSCQETHKSPYFASDSQKPYADFHWRPTMLLAGDTFADAKQLIDRGIKSDFTRPKGSAYLLKTNDVARSSRAVIFPTVAKAFSGLWPVYYLEQDSIKNKADVMFYFTGLTHVPNIKSNTYLPGAIADHLTSKGGILSGSDQMDILEWIKAGATASYGAVVEPCNFPAKFSNPGILLYYYLRGNSLIEAYWKSVAEPGQGVFIGEPLARPFGARKASL
ncbi:MAG: TIGR03790 family protein [Methylococcaceae bacterium]|jgi:uncharacterized protein (TIGR03790 family)